MTVPGIIAELCLTAGAFEFEADDSFTRADAGSLGSAESRQLWVAYKGTPGITGNKAYFSAIATYGLAGVRSIANGDVQTTISGTVDGSGVAFRIQDEDNFMAVIYRSGTGLWGLYEFVGGIATLLDSAAASGASGVVVTQRAEGSTLKTYIDGTHVAALDFTSSSYSSSPNSGIYAESTAARFDDFSASFVWTDITAHLCGELGKVQISAQRGRQHELSQMETGTCDVLLQNDDRRFDPTYEDSPYWPFLLPYRRIRLTPTVDDVPYRRLFTGHIERWPLQYLMPATDGVVKVTAVDRLAVIGSGLWDVYPDVVLGMDPDAYWRMGAA